MTILQNVKVFKIKEPLEIFGRNLWLIWRFRKEKKESNFNPLKSESEFNLFKGKDASIEIYLSILEQEIAGY